MARVLRLGPSLAAQGRLADITSGEESVLVDFARFTLLGYQRAITAAGRTANNDKRTLRGAQALADVTAAILVEGASSKPLALWESAARTGYDTIRAQPQYARRWLLSGQERDFLQLRTQVRDSVLGFLGRMPLPSGHLYAIQGTSSGATAAPVQSTSQQTVPVPIPPIRAPPPPPRREEEPIPEPVERPLRPAERVPAAEAVEEGEEIPAGAAAPAPAESGLISQFLSSVFGAGADPTKLPDAQAEPGKIESGPRGTGGIGKDPFAPEAQTPRPRPPIVTKTIEPMPRAPRPIPAPAAASAAAASILAREATFGAHAAVEARFGTSTLAQTSVAESDLSRQAMDSATISAAAELLSETPVNGQNEIDMFARDVSALAVAASRAEQAARYTQSAAASLSRDLNNGKARAMVRGADEAAHKLQKASTALVIASGAANRAAYSRSRFGGGDRVDMRAAVAEAQAALKQVAVVTAVAVRDAGAGSAAGADSRIDGGVSSRTAASKTSETDIQGVSEYAQRPDDVAPPGESAIQRFLRIGVLAGVPLATAAALYAARRAMRRNVVTQEDPFGWMAEGRDDRFSSFSTPSRADARDLFSGFKDQAEAAAARTPFQGSSRFFDDFVDQNRAGSEA